MSSREHLYELGVNAGRAGAGADAETAVWLRSLVDSARPEQVAGFLDGLAEARPEPPEVSVSWLAIGRAGMTVIA